MKLADLGVSKKQSATWQRLARMPEEEYKELRIEVEQRTRRAGEKPVADQGAKEWGQAVQSVQTPESLRGSAILRFASALMGASEALDRLDPPPTDAEDEKYHLSVTTQAMLRRLNREQRLEVVR